MSTLRQSLWRDTAGVSVVEFALIAPVLLLTMFGLFDVGHNMYTTSMLQGAVQQAARNSTIEGAETRTASLDTKVTNAVKAISPDATVTFQRKSYVTFSDVSQPEDFTDQDNDQICNNGEPFEDSNANGVWDADRGKVGLGGARDAVLYTVTVSYPRLFPIAKLIPGQTDTFTMSTSTVLRNQPFGLQQEPASAIGNCP